MADKEATVYIVDVGSSMGQKNHGRQQSDLDWAMDYVWDKITTTVATGRKTILSGVIGFRTVGTTNELSGEDAFEHISVLQEISHLLLPDLHRLRGLIQTSKTDEGDVISAIVIAIQMITKHCKKLKYSRRIVVVTNGRGSIDADDTSEITKKMKEDNIELIIIGVDFDDIEYGFKEEEKDAEKAANEKILKTLTEDCDGIFGTLAQAIEELTIPRLKSTKPTCSYKGTLTLGDPKQYQTAMVIDVERYPRVMIRRPQTASSFVLRTDFSTRGSAQSSSAIPIGEDGPSTVLSASNPSGLSSVRSNRIYQVDDETAPGGKREVQREDLAKGYEYGRTAVHISESDEGVTKMETEQAMEIIGFIPWNSYDRYMSLSVSNIVIAQRTNSKAILALSSFIHGLFELESYAVVRLVSKQNRPPVLVLLAPSIEADYECLLEVQLPFAEDIRQHKFPPLDRVITVSGKLVKEHRNLPSDALLSAMSDFVDKMDLSTFGKDEEGNPAEYMPMTDTYSPVLHRLDQAVRWRAIHPTEQIPPPYDILTKYMKPPEELQANAKRQLEKLKAAADVKKVPPRLKARRRRRDFIKPVSGLDVDKLLGSEKRIKISRNNAIPEFCQMLEKTDDPNGIRDAGEQLSEIIEAQIKESFGEANYAQVLEEMGVMRQEMIDYEEPGIYNNFMMNLKQKLLADKLGGDRRELWWQIRRNPVGLIDTIEYRDLSEVTPEEAKQFLSTK